MGNALHYICSRCGEVIGLDQTQYVCPHDGGNLDVQIDIDRIRAEFSPATISSSNEASIWRYLPLLPVDHPGHEGTPIWSVGWTPLFKPSVLGSRMGLKQLWVKDDGRNPTASFKDRASAVVVARAQQIGAEVIVTASTGNAGAALAGMAAAASQPAVILAPKSAPPAKVAQLLIFGARVILVEGTYDDAFDLTLEAAEEFGWYCRNTGYNPFTAEGKKTAAFEICEQLTLELDPGGKLERWLAPEAVFVSVGDGNIISGLHKGFKDLKALGWIDRIPRLFGVQSTGSAAIYNAFTAGTEEIEPVQADTLADSISVDLPRDGLRALRAATQTGGAFIAVRDEAILEAIATLGQAAIFAEPAGATAYAGLAAAVEALMVDPSERIVVMNTGSGLKDVAAARRAAGEALLIQPTLKDLKQALK